MADGLPLSSIKSWYLATAQWASLADILPFTSDARAQISRIGDQDVNDDNDDDKVTRKAQRHVDAIVRYFQHTHLW